MSVYPPPSNNPETFSSSDYLYTEELLTVGHGIELFRNTLQSGGLPGSFTDLTATGNLTIAGTASVAGAITSNSSITSGGIIQSAYNYQWSSTIKNGPNSNTNTPLLLLLATSEVSTSYSLGNSIRIDGYIGDWIGQRAKIDIEIKIRQGLQYVGNIFVDNNIALQIEKADLCIYQNIANTTLYYYLIINKNGISGTFYSYDFNVRGSGNGVTLINPASSPTYTSLTISGQTLSQSSVLSQIKFVVINPGQLSVDSLTSTSVSAGTLTSTAATNINVSGSNTTNIGFGGTGPVNIGNTTGGTAITGPVTITGEPIQSTWVKSWSITSLDNTGPAKYYKLATFGPNQQTFEYKSAVKVQGSIATGPGNNRNGTTDFSFTFMPIPSTTNVNTTGYCTSYSTDSGLTTPLFITNGEFVYSTTLISGANYTFDLYYYYNGDASGNTASFQVSKVEDYYNNNLTLYTPTFSGVSTIPNSTLILANLNSNGGIKVVNKNMTISGNCGVNNLTTGGITCTSTANINASGSATTNIGFGGTGTVNIGNTSNVTKVRGSLNVGINASDENTFIGVDSQSNPRMAIIKKSGAIPKFAVDNSGAAFEWIALNNTITPANIASSTVTELMSLTSTSVLSMGSINTNLVNTGFITTPSGINVTGTNSTNIGTGTNTGSVNIGNSATTTYLNGDVAVLPNGQLTISKNSSVTVTTSDTVVLTLRSIACASLITVYNSTDQNSNLYLVTTSVSGVYTITQIDSLGTTTFIPSSDGYNFRLRTISGSKNVSTSYIRI